MKHLALVLGLALGVALSYVPTSDAARNSAGSYSLPTGNPVVGRTTITAAWANTTLSDVANEVTNSLDRQGRGPMLAPLQCANGAPSAPALTFSGDTDTGLYHLAPNDAAIAAGGLKIQEWTPTATTISADAGVTGNLSFGGTLAGPATSLATATVLGATTTGTLALTGSNPAAAVGFANTLTAKNVIKAWAHITTDGAGGATVNDGFNISSVSVSSGIYTRVTFATAMGATKYGAWATAVSPFVGYALSNNTGYVDVYFWSLAAGAPLNPATNSIEFSVLVVGGQ